MVPNPPTKELLPWVHQKNQGYRLIVSKQCEDEFYKDQGVSLVGSLLYRPSVRSVLRVQLGAALLKPRGAACWALAGAPSAAIAITWHCLKMLA